MLMETGIAHLLEAAIKLECGLEVTTRALLVYHQFIRGIRGVHHISYDEAIVAAGSIYLSAKFHEQPIDFDSLICVFFSIVNKTHEVISSEDIEYQFIRRGFMIFEVVMIRNLEFCFFYPVAHQYLVPFFAMIFERSKNLVDFCDELGITTLRFMNDFYTQRACLDYAPELIAITCIDLALYVHGLINDLAMVPAWYMGFICDVTPDIVKELKKKIMSLYEKPLEVIPPRRCFPVQQESIVPIEKEQFIPMEQVIASLQGVQRAVSTQEKQFETTESTTL